MALKTCPTISELSSYLTDEEGGCDHVPDHIETCDSCRKLLRELSDSIGLGDANSFGSTTAKSDVTATLKVQESSNIAPGGPHFSLNILDQAGSGECGSDDGADEPQCCNQNRYSELRPHAKGGLGEVIVARDLELEREVALKRIHPTRADDRNSRLRFVREAKITGKLEHPGVVPVYGRGNDAHGRPYYTMRFIDGDSLKHEISEFHERFGRNAWSRGDARIQLNGLLRRLVDVCNTVDYAHSEGVIHRDLKPRNVVVGKFGETIVVDWGLAKKISEDGIDLRQEPDESGITIREEDQEPTIFGEAVGTLGYMSPEQSDGRLDEIGPRSDVYGLGAILYRILTNQKSQDTNGDREAVLDRIRGGVFSMPREIAREIPASLESICLKAMSTDPNDRYASCRDMARDLARFMANERVEAYKETGFERFVRFVRSRMIIVAVLSAAVVSALAVRVTMQSRNLDAGLKLQNREFNRAHEELMKDREVLEWERKEFEEAKRLFDAKRTETSSNR